MLDNGNQGEWKDPLEAQDMSFERTAKSRPFFESGTMFFDAQMKIEDSDLAGPRWQGVGCHPKHLKD